MFMTPAIAAKKFLNKSQGTITKPTTYLPIILSLVLAIVFLPKIIRQFKLTLKNKAGIRDIEKGSIPSTPTNNSSYAQTTNLSVDALQLYTAFFDNDLFGYSEDEESAIEVLKRVPDKQIPDLAKAYEKINKNKAKGNMYQHVLRYIDLSTLKEHSVYNKINR